METPEGQRTPPPGSAPEPFLCLVDTGTGGSPQEGQGCGGGFPGGSPPPHGVRSCGAGVVLYHPRLPTGKSSFVRKSVTFPTCLKKPKCKRSKKPQFSKLSACNCHALSPLKKKKKYNKVSKFQRKKKERKK